MQKSFVVSCKTFLAVRWSCELPVAYAPENIHAQISQVLRKQFERVREMSSPAYQWFGCSSFALASKLHDCMWAVPAPKHPCAHFLKNNNQPMNGCANGACCAESTLTLFHHVSRLGGCTREWLRHMHEYLQNHIAQQNPSNNPTAYIASFERSVSNERLCGVAWVRSFGARCARVFLVRWVRRLCFAVCHKQRFVEIFQKATPCARWNSKEQ